MDPEQTSPGLSQALQLIRQRWGASALRPAADLIWRPGQMPSLPSGFSALDELLGSHGWPRGRMSEIAGEGSCGRLTLAWAASREAQRRGEVVVWIAAEGEEAGEGTGVKPSLAVRSAADSGVDLARLVLLRPRAASSEGGDMALSVARSSEVGLLVWLLDDLVASPRLESLPLLVPALADSGVSLLVLRSTPPGASEQTGRLGGLAYWAALRLRMRRLAWWQPQGQDAVAGIDVSAEVLKDHVGGRGGAVQLRLVYQPALAALAEAGLMAGLAQEATLPAPAATVVLAASA